MITDVIALQILMAFHQLCTYYLQNVKSAIPPARQHLRCSTVLGKKNGITVDRLGDLHRVLSIHSLFHGNHLFKHGFTLANVTNVDKQ